MQTIYNDSNIFQKRHLSQKNQTSLTHTIRII